MMCWRLRGVMSARLITKHGAASVAEILGPRPPDCWCLGAGASVLVTWPRPELDPPTPATPWIKRDPSTWTLFSARERKSHPTVRRTGCGRWANVCPLICYVHNDGMIRRWRPLLGIAVLPWLSACSITVGWFTLFGGGLGNAAGWLHILLSVPFVLIPGVAFLAFIAVNVLLERRKQFIPTGRFVAGGYFALAATLTAAVLGPVWGGEFDFVMPTWTIVSGHVAFVWLFAAYVWKSQPPHHSLLADPQPQR